MYPEKQEFKSQRVLIDNIFFKLHAFHGDDATGHPIFIVPPHAGRHGNIVQRLAETCVKQKVPVYAYELKTATQENKGLTIEGMVGILHDCVAAIGGSVELIGVCQGAWLGGLFTARFPELVTKYTNFVGPINTKTGEDNSIEKYMETPGVIEYHQKKVDDNDGIQLGSDQWFAFSMINPAETYVGRFLTHQQNLFFDAFFPTEKTAKAVAKWEKNESWYDDSMDLGAWFMEAMKWHFKDNRIYNGTFPPIFGEDVNFKNIKCPVYLFAGGTDLITSIRQVLDMANIVGTDPADIYTEVFEDAGHTKAFVGTEELKRFVKVYFK